MLAWASLEFLVKGAEGQDTGITPNACPNPPILPCTVSDTVLSHSGCLTRQMNETNTFTTTDVFIEYNVLRNITNYQHTCTKPRPVSIISIVLKFPVHKKFTLLFTVLWFEISCASSCFIGITIITLKSYTKTTVTPKDPPSIKVKNLKLYRLWWCSWQIICSKCTVVVANR